MKVLQYGVEKLPCSVPFESFEKVRDTPETSLASITYRTPTPDLAHPSKAFSVSVLVSFVGVLEGIAVLVDQKEPGFAVSVAFLVAVGGIGVGFWLHAASSSATNKRSTEFFIVFPFPQYGFYLNICNNLSQPSIS